MATAHELARWAAMAVDYICVDDVVSFRTESSLDGESTRVTFHMRNGRTKRYTVSREMEGDRPSGQSHPSSP